MALKIDEIQLSDWRSFQERKLRFDPSVTILVGPNATGKTNIIEALQLITTGASFRHPKLNQLIYSTTSSSSCEAARCCVSFKGDGRLLDMTCCVTTDKKTFSKNGKKCSPAAINSDLRAVLFTPDDLACIKRSASYRRDELDNFGKQTNKTYKKILSTYTKSIEQRNHLLRDKSFDMSLLDAWDESIATGGAALFCARSRLFKRLKEKIIPIYNAISDGESFDCRYVSTLNSLSQHNENLDKDFYKKLLYQQLQESRTEDIRRGITTKGPHHDDIEFFVQEKDARSFASQGQQRTIILAWKMAEVELSFDLFQSRPILLLDDVMSELDEKRRKAIIDFIGQDMQTVITTTNLSYFSPEFLQQAKVISFER